MVVRKGVWVAEEDGGADASDAYQLGLVGHVAIDKGGRGMCGSTGEKAARKQHFGLGMQPINGLNLLFYRHLQ